MEMGAKAQKQMGVPAPGPGGRSFKICWPKRQASQSAGCLSWPLTDRRTLQKVALWALVSVSVKWAQPTSQAGDSIDQGRSHL